MPVSEFRIVSFQDELYSENIYVVSRRQDEHAILVDPGMATERALEWVDDQQLTLDAILVSHGHVDHIWGIPEVMSVFPGIPVHMNGADRVLAAETIVDQRGSACPDFVLAVENSPITWGPYLISVLEAPGHTPGSVVFRLGDILFTGDTLFAGSVGRTDLPGGSWEALIQSVRKLYQISADVTALPGHGPSTPVAREAATNPFVSATSILGVV